MNAYELLERTRPPTRIVVREPIAVAPARPTVAAAKELTRRLEQTIVGSA